MCVYCDPMVQKDFPEYRTEEGFKGRVFDTCISEQLKGYYYMEFPNGIDIPIQYCPFCGRALK